MRERRHPGKLRLDKLTPTSPNPDAVLESIDFESAGAESAPFLIAVTVE
jgi:hypothetical protein